MNIDIYTYRIIHIYIYIPPHRSGARNGGLVDRAWQKSGGERLVWSRLAGSIVAADMHESCKICRFNCMMHIHDVHSKHAPGIEEFCAGLGEIAVSDSPLEIKRMQRLGCNGGDWKIWKNFSKNTTRPEKQQKHPPYKLQTFRSLWGERILAFFGWWMFWQDSRSNTLPSRFQKL